MKKLLALSAFFLSYFYCLAQQAEQKFSIGIFGSPNFAYCLEFGSPHVYVPATFFESTHDDLDVPKLGSTFGVLFAWHINSRFQLQTGLTFSNNGWRLKKRITNIGTLGHATNGEQATNLNFYYLDIPVQVKYIFLKKKKFSLYALCGMEANFNMMNRYVFLTWPPDGGMKRRTNEEFYYLDLQKWTTGEPGTYVFRKYNFSASAGVGIDMYINSRLSLFFQPTFRFMALPILDTPVEWRLYSAGLFSGMNIKL